jgi:predicted nucleic acid-binding protein
VDASVVAKWVLPIEVYMENALKLKLDQDSGAAELFAPSFLTFEVTNALWKAVILKRLLKIDAQEALKNLSDMNIGLYELDWGEASEVLEIACELKIAIYDAAYVYLSNKLKAQLVTSDTKLYEKTKDRFQLLHLKDYV